MHSDAVSGWSFYLEVPLALRDLNFHSKSPDIEQSTCAFPRVIVVGTSVEMNGWTWAAGPDAFKGIVLHDFGL